MARDLLLLGLIGQTLAHSNRISYTEAEGKLTAWMIEAIDKGESIEPKLKNTLAELQKSHPHVFPDFGMKEDG